MKGKVILGIVVLSVVLGGTLFSVERLITNEALAQLLTEAEETYLLSLYSWWPKEIYIKGWPGQLFKKEICITNKNDRKWKDRMWFTTTVSSLMDASPEPIDIVPVFSCEPKEGPKDYFVLPLGKTVCLRLKIRIGKNVPPGYYGTGCGTWQSWPPDIMMPSETPLSLPKKSTEKNERRLCT